MIREKWKNITVNELSDNGAISIRARNWCFNADFNTLYDIITYYQQGGKFFNIRNAGSRTCEELRTFCDTIISQTALYEGNKMEQDQEFPKEKKEILSEAKKSLIEKKYGELINASTVRANSALRKFSADEFITIFLYSHNGKLSRIRNIGGKSMNEIIELKEKLKRFIDEIKHLDDYQALHAKIEIEIKNKYGDFCGNDFVIKFYEKHGHFPMLWILEQRLLNDRSISIDILRRSFKIFKNIPTFSLEELARQHNLTRERVRQIRNDVFCKTFKITEDVVGYKNKNEVGKYVELLRNRADWTYLLDAIKERDVLNRDSFEIEECLKKEQCNFSEEFVFQIIAFIFRDDYMLLNPIQAIHKKNSWTSAFLLKKDYSNIFDFEKLREKFASIIENNEVEYLLDIEDYIANSDCWLNPDFSKKDNIIGITRDVLLYEFGLYSEIGEEIKIPVTKKRNIFDLMYEILQKNKNPMHLNDIFAEFKKILPDHKYTDAAQLRSFLLKDERITHRNRSSIYTLKEWTHIRSGTIRGAIIEFLEKNEKPQAVEDIADYVFLFFSTNLKSIYSTMCSGENFIQFRNNLFGLKDKSYPPEYELAEQDERKKSFEQRLLDFEKFIVENEHFPFSSSENKDEESLNRWWRLTLKGTTKINDEQKLEIERVVRQYENYNINKNRYEWDFNYDKLKCFLLENRRLPSAMGDEKFLYGWLRRANSDFQEDKLDEGQRKKYIELMSII